MNKILAVVLALGVIVALYLSSYSKQEQVGSVQQGGEYQSTTTSTGRFATGSTVLCTTNATLGSVVVTGAAAGVINFYNATTANPTLRHSQYSTSSIWMTNIPTSAAANTYTFDAVAPIGLVLDIQGTMPTTTITYRCY